MEEFDKSLKTHLFICCRQRDKKACCGAKDSEKWVKELKDWSKKQGLKGKVNVAKSSCLGQCELGVAAVFYPQNRWFRNLTDNDLDKLKELLDEYGNS